VPAFLIDTGWIIDHFSGVSSRTSRLQELQPQGLAVSIISVAELWEGILFSRDPPRSRALLERFLQGVAVLNLDERICRQFGQLRGELRNRGEVIGDFDLLIAATALVHDLTLLTNNRMHFQRLQHLRIESA